MRRLTTIIVSALLVVLLTGFAAHTASTGDHSPSGTTKNNSIQKLNNEDQDPQVVIENLEIKNISLQNKVTRLKAERKVHLIMLYIHEVERQKRETAAASSAASSRSSSSSGTSAPSTTPTTHTHTTPTPVNNDSGCAYENEIRAVFGSAGDWAVSIAMRESRCQADAANSSSSARGLFQLLLSYHGDKFRAVGCSPEQWADPMCNIRAAKYLYDMAGTSPWAL